ncbi:hypothetical protein [Chryseobacterium sp. RR2-3-20]|uniref:hypothetical protein n=1 Tax=Chryseobacterium sp. RR2-3-20 TaxID=2787626 RepID=UPI001ADFA2D2|nr:hypothetical protein [Chryseobacterium sp. RR2-3-20]
MKKIFYFTSSVAMSFFLTGCQNSILEANSEEVSNVKSVDSFKAYGRSTTGLTGSAVMLSDYLAQSGIKSNTEITQGMIDNAMSEVELEGEGVVSVSFVSEVLSGIHFANENGTEALYRQIGFSDFVIEQLLRTEKFEDISSCTNDTRYSSLSEKEKKFLDNVIIANTDLLAYLKDNPVVTLQSRNFDNNTLYSAITFGNVGMAIGFAFMPAGPLVGYVVGFAVGLVADIFK